MGRAQKVRDYYGEMKRKYPNWQGPKDRDYYNRMMARHSYDYRYQDAIMRAVTAVASVLPDNDQLRGYAKRGVGYGQRVYKELGGYKPILKAVVPKKYHAPLALARAMYGAYASAPKQALQWADQRRIDSGAPSTAVTKYGETPPPPQLKWQRRKSEYAGRWFVGRRHVNKVVTKRRKSFYKRRNAKKRRF